ncbi:ABC-type branched-subunit amino acid transport system substrate-binding protein [Rhodobium orientis]|uniref:Ethanolamine utilization protein EutM n=1 Tax=Rhodobium orientis TaxID=34017 RepID=A0A327JNM0_9HYPH|nr:penicillin-binding protein activator [Rhodobium orientis]MBB4301982.1 ABC-type branched-subunit amino acid transport system substrate-binding protein [Rhodobium orientis]MBK5950219.1 ethanolamine utilization protein EutM [Rhodobium orientis]RAI27176.1 ethanolamine utilization protein EutM [Rhodobium orientis]
MRNLKRGAVVAAVLAVAACGGGGGFSGWGSGPSRSSGPVAPSGETIGSGSVRVGLLLPNSAGGDASSVARLFRNSAELAINDFQGGDIQLLVKDTNGSSEGGKAAAQAAIAEGAELIIGPVFAPAVGGAAAAARSSGVPVVAFSSNSSVAARGVYLLSFLPQNDVRRIVSFAAKRGKKSFAAIVPSNAYGQVVEASFRQYAGEFGVRVLGIERYDGTEADIRAKAEAIATLGPQIDAVFIPDGGGAARIIAGVLAQKGVTSQTVQMLGTSQWDNPAILADSSLRGGWFPGTDKAGYQKFASRYQAAYGVSPPRTGTLAYDATILAAGLVRSAGARRFSEDILTNPDGFLGIDGVFRFRRDGTNERGLAVYEVASGQARIVDPAPKSFSAGY